MLIESLSEIHSPLKAAFPPKALSQLLFGLTKQKAFKIRVQWRRQGFSYAGSAAGQGTLNLNDAADGPMNGSTMGEFAAQNAATDGGSAHRVPCYRITVNDRLGNGERFVTLSHELGHIFCGHLGGCSSRANVDEGG